MSIVNLTFHFWHLFLAFILCGVALTQMTTISVQSNTGLINSVMVSVAAIVIILVLVMIIVLLTIKRQRKSR